MCRLQGQPSADAAVFVQVELQCGPFRVVSLMFTEAVRDLELERSDPTNADIRGEPLDLRADLRPRCERIVFVVDVDDGPAEVRGQLLAVFNWRATPVRLSLGSPDMRQVDARVGHAPGRADKDTIAGYPPRWFSWCCPSRSFPILCPGSNDETIETQAMKYAKAILYARFSNERLDGSLERMVAELQALAKSQGIGVAAVIDEDDVSARTSVDKRNGCWADVVAGLTDGTWDCLVVRGLDRWALDMVETIKLAQLNEERGFCFAALNGDSLGDQIIAALNG
jgi:hypothetical protein